MIEFGVVTEVPNPKGPDVWQNLALPGGGAWQQTGHEIEQVRMVPPHVLLSLRVPVFTRGEIMVMEDGREVCGHGRRPDKWGVSVELFPTIDEAIARARALA